MALPIQVCYFETTMRIGCDLDGVIIDHHMNERRLVAKCGIVIPRGATARIDIKNLFSPAEYDEMRKELYGAYSIVASEVIGARRALKQLVRQGHDVRIISRRHPKSRQFARRWLSLHGFEIIIPASHIHFIAGGASKEALCKKFSIDVYVDDWDFELRHLVTPRVKVLFGSQLKKPFSGVIGVPTWSALACLIAKISKR